MLSLPQVARGYLVLAVALGAGCTSGDLAAPVAEAPDFARSARVTTLVITTLPGDPNDPGFRFFYSGTPTVVQVQALDKKGRPLSRIDISAESVDWVAHWPGLTSPPPDPAAQTVQTDATGTATFTLLYPSPMRFPVTWRATAGQATVEIGLRIEAEGINPFCSDYIGQYTQEQVPECFD